VKHPFVDVSGVIDQVPPPLTFFAQFLTFGKVPEPVIDRPWLDREQEL
jgi:hypothetical protein